MNNSHFNKYHNLLENLNLNQNKQINSSKFSNKNSNNPEKNIPIINKILNRVNFDNKNIDDSNIFQENIEILSQNLIENIKEEDNIKEKTICEQDKNLILNQLYDVKKFSEKTQDKNQDFSNFNEVYLEKCVYCSVEQLKHLSKNLCKCKEINGKNKKKIPLEKNNCNKYNWKNERKDDITIDKRKNIGNEEIDELVKKALEETKDKLKSHFLKGRHKKNYQKNFVSQATQTEDESSICFNGFLSDNDKM